MNNVHLRINYGGEERFDFVRRTIAVSVPYFTTIQVVNFGPDENSKRFDPLLEKYSNLSISNMGRYYHACITEDLLRSYSLNIPNGEWLIFLDSDWRLPQVFLDNMQKEIDICESGGFNALYSYQLGHILNDVDNVSPGVERNFNMSQQMIDAFVERVTKDPGNYGWPLLQKIEKSSTFFSSILGNHCCYTPIPYKYRYVPYMIHLHFRHFDEYAYDSTMLFFSWWYLGHNTFSVEDNRKTFSSWEYSAHEAFKLKHKCFTSNSLREKMKDPAFLKELKDLFLSFEKSELFTCKQMYRIASKYDMKLWTTPLESECNGVCCQYKEGRIYDL